MQNDAQAEIACASSFVLIGSFYTVSRENGPRTRTFPARSPFLQRCSLHRCSRVGQRQGATERGYAGGDHHGLGEALRGCKPDAGARRKRADLARRQDARDARTRHPTRHAFPIARLSGCIPERCPIASSRAKPATAPRSSQPCGELGHRRTPHRQARQPNLGDPPQRIRLCFGTPVNWRTRRGSANAWLKGTLTRGTPALYSAQPNRANNSHRKSNFPKLARVWDLTCAPDVSGFSSPTFPQVSASTSSKALRVSSTSPKLERVRDRSCASLGQRRSFSSA